MILKSFLLALALCVDSFVVSATAGLKSQMPLRRGLLLAAIFALFQGGLPLLGALIGNGFQSHISGVDHWIAFGLLAIVGGRTLWESLQGKKIEKPMDFSSLGVIILLAIATSIDAFVVGISLGIECTVAESVATALIIAFTTFVVSTIGVSLGRYSISIPDRWAGLLAGFVLIGLGVHILLEHWAAN